MLECLNRYRTVWSTLDESDNFQQIHDESLARDRLRPMIREKIKKEVDLRLLSYLDNIRLKVAQRAAAKKAAKKKKGKKGKKGGSAKKSRATSAAAKKPDGEAGADGEEKAADGEEKSGGDGAAAVASARAASGKKKGKKSGSGKKKKKLKKCCEGEKACAHMPLGDMISLLVKMGILQEMRKPLKTVADLKGDIHWLGSDYVNADVTLDPSMQQLRSVITETFILPLGSTYVKEQSPLVNTLLLYGPHGSGKSLLSKAIAAETVRQMRRQGSEATAQSTLPSRVSCSRSPGVLSFLSLSCPLLRTRAGSISLLATSSVSSARRPRLRSWSTWCSRWRRSCSRR